MRHFSNGLTLCALAWLLAGCPAAVSAQTSGKAPEAERGWGSVWKEPASEKQRQSQELLRKLVAAQVAGNSSAAMTICNQLVALSPEAPGPYMNRAREHTRLKQYDRALSDLDVAQEKAGKQQNPSASANVLAMRSTVHARQKNYPAAVSDLRAAIKIDDKNASAYNDFAWLRATATDAAYRDGPESVRYAQKSVSLTRTYSYAAIDTLAAAYAEANDFPRAIDSEKRAMTAAENEIKNAGGAQQFRKAARERLQLFEQHQAYHATPQ